MTKFLNLIIEILNWLKIVTSPFLIGLALGIGFYIFKPDMTGIIIGGLIVAIGLAVGIYLAAQISKHVGATKFMFKINETRDIDESWKDKSSN